MTLAELPLVFLICVVALVAVVAVRHYHQLYVLGDQRFRRHVERIGESTGLLLDGRRLRLSSESNGLSVRFSRQIHMRPTFVELEFTRPLPAWLPGLSLTGIREIDATTGMPMGLLRGQLKIPVPGWNPLEEVHTQDVARALLPETAPILKELSALRPRVFTSWSIGHPGLKMSIRLPADPNITEDVEVHWHDTLAPYVLQMRRLTDAFQAWPYASHEEVLFALATRATGELRRRGAVALMAGPDATRARYRDWTRREGGPDEIWLAHREACDEVIRELPVARKLALLVELESARRRGDELGVAPGMTRAACTGLEPSDVNQASRLARIGVLRGWLASARPGTNAWVRAQLDADDGLEFASVASEVAVDAGASELVLALALFAADRAESQRGRPETAGMVSRLLRALSAAVGDVPERDGAAVERAVLRLAGPADGMSAALVLAEVGTHDALHALRDWPSPERRLAKQIAIATSKIEERIANLPSRGAVSVVEAGQIGEISLSVSEMDHEG